MASEEVAPDWGAERSRVITWHDPGLLARELPTMDGLAALQAMLAGTYPPPSIAAALGFTLGSVAPGEAVFTCTPDESLYNPLGTVHGGVVCTLLDSAIGCAVQTTLEAGVAYTSIDIMVNYLRPVTLDSGNLLATGRVIKPGRRVATATAEVHDGAGHLVATASSNCLIMRST
jgi:uncharacterized protein (TIGR00369 family)